MSLPHLIKPLSGGLSLHYRLPEADAARIIEEAAGKSRELITETWGLPTPKRCRVYVMTSWQQFFLDSAPMHWLPVMALLSPLWVFRARKLWKYVGGWMQPYGARQAVGVKPPHLMLESDRSIGERVFCREDDVLQKVRHVTCHELTHAFTASLRLPTWLQEGVAMNTVDLFFNTDTVRTDTLDYLAHERHPARPNLGIPVNPANVEVTVYHYVRGYWITRLLVETDLSFLKSLLQARMSARTLEAKVARRLGVDPRALWQEANRITVAHFRPYAPSGPA